MLFILALYLLCIHQCNNPLTKEPKLEAAVRIVEEWPLYDNEIKEFMEKWSNNKTIQVEDNQSKPKSKFLVKLHVCNATNDLYHASIHLKENTINHTTPQTYKRLRL